MVCGCLAPPAHARTKAEVAGEGAVQVGGRGDARLPQRTSGLGDHRRPAGLQQREGSKQSRCEGWGVGGSADLPPATAAQRPPQPARRPCEAGAAQLSRRGCPGDRKGAGLALGFTPTALGSARLHGTVARDAGRGGTDGRLHFEIFGSRQDPQIAGGRQARHDLGPSPGSVRPRFRPASLSSSAQIQAQTLNPAAKWRQEARGSPCWAGLQCSDEFWASRARLPPSSGGPGSQQPLQRGLGPPRAQRRPAPAGQRE